MLTRRQFLKSGCAAAAASALPGPVAAGGLGTPADMESYRALVCIVLGGGADSYNMLVPMDATAYATYARRRGKLALRPDELEPLSNGDGQGKSYAMHQGLGELAGLYAAGEVALLANVGPLPVNREYPGSARAPKLAHTDLIRRWHLGTADICASSGWAGRVADVLEQRSCSGRLPINLSMSGPNAMQLGCRTVAANLGSNTLRCLPGVPAGVDFGYFEEQLAMRVLSCGGPAHVRRQMQLMQDTASSSSAIVSDVFLHTPAIETRFEADPFARDLKRVARIIAARELFEARRQIFFVHFNGWDHHHELRASQAIMLPLLSRGLAAFRNALVEAGAFDLVTTFTVSEFGRALESDNSGSDHGWGGHQLIMGGAVRGGRIYGRYPDLAAFDSLDAGGGVFTPTTTMEAYLAEMMLWLGLVPSDLPYVLPDTSKNTFGKGFPSRIGLLA